MNKKIQPQVNKECKVTCVCGSSFTTISTLNEIKVDICSSCHPFYTGTAKFVDTEGRIDKFNRKLQKITETKDKSVKDKKAKSSSSKGSENLTLKELLDRAKKDSQQ